MMSRHLEGATFLSEVGDLRMLTVVCLFTIAGVALGTGSAHAQLGVQVTNAPPNEEVEVRLSGEDVADTGTATSSAGGDLSMLLNAGSLGKAQPAAITVYIENCEDGANVHLVAAGRVIPAGCDEETEQDRDAGMDLQIRRSTELPDLKDSSCTCSLGEMLSLGRDTTWISVDFRTGAVSARNDSTLFPVPSQEEQDQLQNELRNRAFNVGPLYGRLHNMMPISGQGVIKHSDGPESRMTATPDSFNVFGRF